MHRRLAVLGRVLLLGSRFKPAWLGGTTATSLAKILENMEIGHNVLHGQWDWMNDPQIHSSTWDWDTASTAEAWKHSHNYIHHTYTNIRGKDKDLGYEIMRIDPHQKWHPVYLLQPIYNVLLMAAVRVGRRVPRPRPRGAPQGREAQGAGRQGAQGHRRQGAHPDRQGLRRLAAGERGWRRRRCTPRRPRRRERARTRGLRARLAGAAGASALRGRARSQRRCARSAPRCGPTPRRTSSATSGRTRSSSAATSRTRRTRSARTRWRTRAAAPGTCASSSAPRTSRAARCSTSPAATSATRSSTTCSPTCRAPATPRSRRG